MTAELTGWWLGQKFDSLTFINEVIVSEFNRISYPKTKRKVVSD